MRREVGSIIEVTPGVFRVSVSVGHSSITGKRRRPTQIVRGTDRDAEIALARLLLERRQAAGAGGHACASSSRRCSCRTSRSGGASGRSTATAPSSRITFVPELGDTALVDLTPYGLERWMDGLSKVGSDPTEPLSEQTRLHVYRCLFAALADRHAVGTH